MGFLWERAPALRTPAPTQGLACSGSRELELTLAVRSVSLSEARWRVSESVGFGTRRGLSVVAVLGRQQTGLDRATPLLNAWGGDACWGAESRSDCRTDRGANGWHGEGAETAPEGAAG